MLRTDRMLTETLAVRWHAGPDAYPPLRFGDVDQVHPYVADLLQDACGLAYLATVDRPRQKSGLWDAIPAFLAEVLEGRGETYELTAAEIPRMAGGAGRRGGRAGRPWIGECRKGRGRGNRTMKVVRSGRPRQRFGGPGGARSERGQPPDVESAGLGHRNLEDPLGVIVREEFVCDYCAKPITNSDVLIARLTLRKRGARGLGREVGLALHPGCSDRLTANASGMARTRSPRAEVVEAPEVEAPAPPVGRRRRKAATAS